MQECPKAQEMCKFCLGCANVT